MKLIKTKMFSALISTTLILFFGSCGILWNIETDCRDFKFHGEEYWFPESVGDNVVFKDSENNEKVFKVVKKKSSHVTKYYTDTGCGCKDYSIMKLISNSDTIYLMRLSKYIYDNDAETIEDIVFMFNTEHSIFFETEFNGYENLTIDSVQLDKCRVYVRDYDKGRRINKVIFAKGIGIVQYIMQDGTVWTNSDLSIIEENNLDSFDYSENVCN